LKIILLIKKQSVINIVGYLIPAVIISRAFPLFTFVYYLLPVLFLLVFIQGYEFIFKDRNLRSLLLLFLVFGLWSAVTSFWSDYPLITLMRAGYFVFIALGGVMTGYIWFKTNPDSLALSLPANVVIIILSLFSLITNIPADSWTGGHGKGFMGFTGHQNILAAAILLTLPGVFNLLIKIREPNQPDPLRLESRKTKFHIPIFLTYSLIVANFLIIILTYSRASILSVVIGIMMFLIFIKAYKILSAIFVLSIVFLILFLSVYPINHSINNLLNKGGGNVLSRRIILWEPSFEASKMGGIFGLGYGMSAPDIKTPKLTGSHYENGRYIREKGNSVLAVIEESGWIGFILFLMPIVHSFVIFFHRHQVQYYEHLAKSKTKPISKKNYSLYIVYSALIALLVHSQFEGWWVGVGSIHLPIFYLLLSMTVKSPAKN